jgi:hypothetical protein
VAQSGEPATAAGRALLWETCGGTTCSCHDPFLCSDCGCTHNEAEASASPALDVEALSNVLMNFGFDIPGSISERIAAEYARLRGGR